MTSSTGGEINRRSMLMALGRASAAGWLVACNPGTATTVASSSTLVTNPPDLVEPPREATTEPSTSTTSSRSSTSVAVSTTQNPRAETIDLVCRDEWGADPPSQGMVEHTINRVTVHHTAVVIAAADDSHERARQHQAYHLSLGWPDLAYHFLIGADGGILEGRPVDFRGDTATDYDPTGHLLICLEGNFDEQPVPDSQWDSLVRLASWGVQTYAVEPSEIAGHRDLASTSCPGDHLAERLADGELVAAIGALGRVEIKDRCR